MKVYKDNLRTGTLTHRWNFSIYTLHFTKYSQDNDGDWMYIKRKNKYIKEGVVLCRIISFGCVFMYEMLVRLL